MTSVAAKGAVEINFGAINEQNVEQLRKLNLSIFPVRYNPKFYQNVITTPTEITQFAYSQGFVVGAICCRLEPPTGAGPKKLYIMTIGVLTAYRRLGVGRKLLERMLAHVTEGKGELGDVTEVIKRLSSNDECARVYLHVQTSNEEALSFYKKQGFTQGELIKGYYKRIEPPDCYIVSKAIRT